MSAIGGTQAYAAACTYNEAILALEQGNQVRGLALLNMAARDGDQRATQYLASRSFQQNPQQNFQQNFQQNNNLVAYKQSQD